MSSFRTDIVEPGVEGKLMQGFEDVDVGDRVRVKVRGANVERGFTDLIRAR